MLIFKIMNFFLNNAYWVLLFCLSCSFINPLPQTHKSIKLSQMQRRIVIDAGHGGEDSGAVGHKGLLEKHITLDIARRLNRLFARYMPQVDVILTRSKDQYVSLEERVNIANKTTADVFISLHVNSSEEKSARGYEIYSLDIASDRHAERLAARENKAVNGQAQNVNFILADLRAHSHRRDSDRLGHSIALGLKSQLMKIENKIQFYDRGYNQAIFHVLFVKMPAVLAELFFISNPEEEKMLASSKTREFIARGIFLGIKNFLENSPPRIKHASR
jgi:N-acetylmuramoyl-L-alanine amidase